MQIALICEKCGSVHSSNSEDEATLIVDFRQKYMSFICQNKKCKHDNIFSMSNWKDRVTTSPLPGIKISR